MKIFTTTMATAMMAIHGLFFLWIAMISMMTRMAFPMTASMNRKLLNFFHHVARIKFTDNNL